MRRGAAGLAGFAGLAAVADPSAFARLRLAGLAAAGAWDDSGLVAAAFAGFWPEGEPFGEAVVEFDGDEFGDATVEQCAREAAGAGADFDDSLAFDAAACVGDAFEDGGIKQEVLAEGFLRGAWG